MSNRGMFLNWYKYDLQCTGDGMIYPTPQYKQMDIIRLVHRALNDEDIGKILGADSNIYILRAQAYTWLG